MSALHTAFTRHDRTARLVFLNAEFEAQVMQMAVKQKPENLDVALELARLPQMVRGFGHVKAHNQVAADARQALLLTQFEQLWAAESPHAMA